MYVSKLCKHRIHFTNAASIVICKTLRALESDAKLLARARDLVRADEVNLKQYSTVYGIVIGVAQTLSYA
jgi:hypothetical protein